MTHSRFCMITIDQRQKWLFMSELCILSVIKHILQVLLSFLNICVGKNSVANIPPHPVPILIPGATQQSGATKSKMARAIYHQCSCPITRGWNKKYTLRAIKNPACPVSWLMGLDETTLSFRSMSFLCLFLSQTIHRLFPTFPPPISLPICLIAFPLWADEIATGPTYRGRKKRRESDDGRYEKWLSCWSCKLSLLVSSLLCL